jgi:hypothetical protein
MARHGKAGHGKAWQGRAGHGRAWQGRAGQGMARQGKAGQGMAGQGMARQGRARQGRAIQRLAAALPYVGAYGRHHCLSDTADSTPGEVQAGAWIHCVGVLNLCLL